MNDENYEQIELQKDWVGDERIPYLQEGMKVVIEMHEDRPIGLSLPDQVTLEVVETEPTVKGQTASSSYKPAIANNGVRIMIPPYMSAGERIVVDTETGEYVRRAD
jgi:elongation factor P